MAKKNNQLSTRAQCVAIMKRYGMPMATINAIMICLVDDSVRNGNDVKSDRIYSLIALMLHRVFGFGVKRIMRFMHAFDGAVGEVAEGGREWPEIMADLEAETGIVVHSGDGDRFAFEYVSKEENTD